MTSSNSKRRTLFIQLSFSLQEDNSRIKSYQKFFQGCYRIQLIDLPAQIPLEVFDFGLKDPSPENLISHLSENLLILALDASNYGYIGVFPNYIHSRSSILLPVPFSWEMFENCARQTTSAPISFK